MIVWRVIILSALAYGNDGEAKSRKKRIDEGIRFDTVLKLKRYFLKLKKNK